MGRKNRSWTRLSKTEQDFTKCGGLLMDPAMKSYTSRLHSQVDKYCDIIKACKFSSDDYQEMENCIELLKNLIWDELKRHRNTLEGIIVLESKVAKFSIISYETFYDIMASDKLPPIDYDITDHMSLIFTLLTAESLKEEFENVLVYTRYLTCCISYDEDGIPRLRDTEGQYYMKRYVNINWKFKKWGITVSQIQPNTTRVWNIPGTMPELTIYSVNHPQIKRAGM